VIASIFTILISQLRSNPESRWRVSGSEFRVSGFGFRVSGFGFKEQLRVVAGYWFHGTDNKAEIWFRVIKTRQRFNRDPIKSAGQRRRIGVKTPPTKKIITSRIINKLQNDQIIQTLCFYPGPAGAVLTVIPLNMIQAEPAEKQFPL